MTNFSTVANYMTRPNKKFADYLLTKLCWSKGRFLPKTLLSHLTFSIVQIMSAHQQPHSVTGWSHRLTSKFSQPIHNKKTTVVVTMQSQKQLKPCWLREGSDAINYSGTVTETIIFHCNRTFKNPHLKEWRMHFWPVKQTHTRAQTLAYSHDKISFFWFQTVGGAGITTQWYSRWSVPYINPMCQQMFLMTERLFQLRF